MFNTTSIFNRRKLAIATAAFLIAAVIVATTVKQKACASALVNKSMSAEVSSDNPLIGLWEMTVVGEASTYLYKYTISESTWIAIGNVDGGFFNFRYAPTLGAYVKNADGSYRYREIGWTYTKGGVCNGSFESIGTFVLDASGNTFNGPGSFKQFDLTGRIILTDNFTVVATKVGV